MPSPADWQLPRGVSREVWDHLHDSTVARRYDESLVGTPLLDLDRWFVTNHCQPPGRVIDLGCGTGRVAVPLARLGHAVTAVDLSKEMLCVAGEKAAAAGVRLDRVQANIVELDGFRDATFDTAICMFATLGMIAGPEARSRCRSCVLVAQTGRPIHPARALPLASFADGRRPALVNPRSGAVFSRPRQCRRLADGAPRRPNGLDHAPLYAREVSGLLRSAGFAVTEVLPVGLAADGRLRSPWLFGGLRPYGYLIAARKPESTGETRQPALS